MSRTPARRRETGHPGALLIDLVMVVLRPGARAVVAPQQRQIIYLAGTGPTSCQIADRVESRPATTSRTVLGRLNGTGPCTLG